MPRYFVTDGFWHETDEMEEFDTEEQACEEAMKCAALHHTKMYVFTLIKEFPCPSVKS